MTGLAQLGLAQTGVPLVSGDWDLLDPWFLLLIPVVLVLLAWRARRARAALPAASIAPLRGLPRSLRARLVALPLIAKAVALAVLGVALARPVTRELLPLREVGVDMLLLIDVSSSMLSQDMEASGQMRRIDAAKKNAELFVAAREHDRIGLMTFALFPELRCPLTLDHEALSAFLRAVETVHPNSPEDGTGIGVALAKAVTFLEKSTTKSKVIVLLTDGLNNRPEIQPLDAARVAKDAGIRVHTIGLGQGEHVFGFARPIDFGDIRQVAETTGGQFFAAPTARDLGRVYEEIDRMEKVEIEDPRYRTTDWFLWPLLAGASLLVLAFAAELAWIRGTP